MLWTHISLFFSSTPKIRSKSGSEAYSQRLSSSMMSWFLRFSAELWLCLFSSSFRRSVELSSSKNSSCSLTSRALAINGISSALISLLPLRWLYIDGIDGLSPLLFRVGFRERNLFKKSFFFKPLFFRIWFIRSSICLIYPLRVILKLYWARLCY